MLAILCGLLATQARVPAEGFVQRPDLRLHFRTVGSGKPLVFLSGGPGQDVKQLQEIYEVLKADRLCILLDQRATGKSTLTKLDKSTVNLDAYIEDVEALRKELKLDKLSLIGHSWGSILALSYAVKYPQNLDELVLVSMGPASLQHFQLWGNVIEHRRNLLNARGQVDEGKDLFELRPFFFDQKKAEAFSKRSTEGHVSTVVSHLLVPDLLERKLDLVTPAANIRCRTLILQGRHDAALESSLIELKNQIPGGQLQFVERAGHFPWIEQPEEFFKVLGAWLASGRTAQSG